jgi:maltose alpha-D-glucosyltransferase/alpha-amylase
MCSEALTPGTERSLRRSRQRRPGPKAGSAVDPLWHKDALIYQVHVRTFCDSNGDGVGDFPGLTSKLDYIQRLGVTAIWLMPFYESPLKDDGYDIAHYERIDPRYGTIEDFKVFIAEVHRRGLQLFTELVINHTSAEHPWFQAARRAPAGSEKRNFYVWSDTDQRYLGARIIFTDVEKSNWTWDPVAGQFYFHRFFAHQPDLNFDNPRVQRTALKVMRFWLDLGVDGLRLDAVSHLFEREGTSCENLPETHVFLKKIRAEMDCCYTNRVVLAEADQLPAAARPYFGAGDECHMAFHFPLMPKLFLALARELAAGIVEIVKETDFLPETCQWAIFLRNHDEMALSTVTHAERVEILDFYAPDPRMRLNWGIRRRLAPLFGNDRRRLRLAISLMFSLPGTPVIYYGDELGMGDNIWLNDRDGVRTPMQWNDTPNAGFSSSTGHLISPLIEDDVYGYRTLNVAAQDSDPESPLAWMRELIRLRRAHQVFGRGTTTFVETHNAAVLGFWRRYRDEEVLVLANLSTTLETCTLLPPHRELGSAVVDLVKQARCEVAPDQPFKLTLAPSAFVWLLPDRAAAPSNTSPASVQSSI